MNLYREMIRPFGIGLVVAAVWATTAAAQTPLTLTDAIARARAQNPDAGSAAAAEREASQRVRLARAGLLPRVDLTESWQRGNQPVFVFSSLLAQRRFSDANFALPSLNRPSPVDNFQAAIVAEQSIFDDRTRTGVTAARISHEIAGTRRQIVDRGLAVEVTAAYGRVLMAVAAGESAKAAADAARADRELAGNRRDAGLVTDADVLQLDVFVARRREGLIRAAADERTARAELNALMGEPLDTTFVLQRGIPRAAIETGNVAALEAEADANRAEVKGAALEERLASAHLATARAAFLPQVSARAGWEFNGGAWNTRASSWVVGLVARINLFHGFADQAQLAEARERVTRLALERRKVQTAARLDVHLATARLDAARAGEAVGRAAVAQARESRRIIRDRYEGGLTDVAALLRATEALVQAEAQQTAAEVAVLIETAALERALGR
jgi:outer membrane protein TolC